MGIQFRGSRKPPEHVHGASIYAGINGTHSADAGRGTLIITTSRRETQVLTLHSAPGIEEGGGGDWETSHMVTSTARTRSLRRPLYSFSLP